MALTHKHWILANRQSAALFYISALTFIIAAVLGMAGAMKIGLPEAWVGVFDFAKLRPLHTFFSIVALAAGLFGITEAIIQRDSPRHRRIIPLLQTTSIILFTITGAAALSLGRFSGREYFSWPPALSIFLFLPLAAATWDLVRHHETLSRRSPEAYWLLCLGMILLCLGCIESHFWLLPIVGANSVRDLTVQWHGLDTFIAGINVAFYGGAVFIMTPKAKGLRAPWLLTIAGFSLLFTFGHHHYISPQPGFLKIFAFIASMIAILSFFRHIHYYRKIESDGESEAHRGLQPLLLGVELWTIVAVASGILFAIPHVNLIVHGTYLIVIHSMGSLIGINLFITLAGAIAFIGSQEAYSASAVKWGVRLVNYSLWGFWLLFSIAGVSKGIWRMEMDYTAFSVLLQRYYLLFPVVGLGLLAGIYILCSEVMGICMEFITRPASVPQPTPPEELEGMTQDPA